MLTNIYYYDFYKPYIVNSTNQTKKISTDKNEYKKKIATENNEKSEGFSYFLNTSLKNDVVKYAKTISSDFNAIRDTSRYLMQQVDSRRLSLTQRQENVKNGLEDFVNQYNDYKDFAQDNQSVSNVLGEYSDNLDRHTDNNSEIFEKFGVTKNDDGTLNYNCEAVGEMDYNSISEIKDAVSGIYDDTVEVMSLPMSQHMNFKGLDYYYNYMYAKVDTKNSFRMIETGMLVDIEV